MYVLKPLQQRSRQLSHVGWWRIVPSWFDITVIYAYSALYISGPNRGNIQKRRRIRFNWAENTCIFSLKYLVTIIMAVNNIYLVYLTCSLARYPTYYWRNLRGRYRIEYSPVGCSLAPWYYSLLCRPLLY